MPNYRDIQKAMRPGPPWAHAEAEEVGSEGTSYIVPPYSFDTGSIDERTRMMLEAMDRLGGLSRMPYIDPDIPVPNPEGALPETSVGDMNEWVREGEIEGLMQDKLLASPKDYKYRNIYNPAMPEEDAQRMIQQLLDEHLAR
jgi:hypothetical protein